MQGDGLLAASRRGLDPGQAGAVGVPGQAPGVEGFEQELVFAGGDIHQVDAVEHLTVRAVAIGRQRAVIRGEGKFGDRQGGQHLVDALDFAQMKPAQQTALCHILGGKQVGQTLPIRRTRTAQSPGQVERRAPQQKAIPEQIVGHTQGGGGYRAQFGIRQKLKAQRAEGRVEALRRGLRIEARALHPVESQGRWFERLGSCGQFPIIAPGIAASQQSWQILRREQGSLRKFFVIHNGSNHCIREQNAAIRAEGLQAQRYTGQRIQPQAGLRYLGAAVPIRHQHTALRQALEAHRHQKGVRLRPGGQTGQQHQAQRRVGDPTTRLDIQGLDNYLLGITLRRIAIAAQGQGNALRRLFQRAGEFQAARHLEEDGLCGFRRCRRGDRWFYLGALHKTSARIQRAFVQPGLPAPQARRADIAGRPIIDSLRLYPGRLPQAAALAHTLLDQPAIGVNI